MARQDRIDRWAQLDHAAMQTGLVDHIGLDTVVGWAAGIQAVWFSHVYRIGHDGLPSF